MLPFPIISNTTVIDTLNYQLGYNFDTQRSYGLSNIVPDIASTNIPIPVITSGYSTMRRLTNSTVKMLPTGLYNIGSSDFEMRFVFYLYAGSSYDVLMHYGNNDMQYITSGIVVQISDAGLLNRLTVGINGENSGNSTMYTCNVDRSALTGKVSNLLVRRKNKLVTMYLNGSPLMFGVYTDASTNLSLPNNEVLNTTFLNFGEYQNQWGVDMGIIDFNIKVI